MNPTYTRCRTCGAEIGVKCSSPKGRPHVARIRKVGQPIDETLPWRLQ